MPQINLMENKILQKNLPDSLIYRNDDEKTRSRRVLDTQVTLENHHLNLKDQVNVS